MGGSDPTTDGPHRPSPRTCLDHLREAWQFLDDAMGRCDEVIGAAHRRATITQVRLSNIFQLDGPEPVPREISEAINLMGVELLQAHDALEAIGAEIEIAPAFVEYVENHMDELKAIQRRAENAAVLADAVWDMIRALPSWSSVEEVEDLKVQLGRHGTILSAIVDALAELEVEIFGTKERVRQRADQLVALIGERGRTQKAWRPWMGRRPRKRRKQT